MNKINFNNYKQFKTLQTKKQFYISEIINLIFLIFSLFILIKGFSLNNIYLISGGILFLSIIIHNNCYFFCYDFYKTEWKNNLECLLFDMQDIELLLKQKEL